MNGPHDRNEGRSDAARDLRAQPRTLDELLLGGRDETKVENEREQTTGAASQLPSQEQIDSWLDDIGLQEMSPPGRLTDRKSTSPQATQRQQQSSNTKNQGRPHRAQAHRNRKRRSYVDPPSEGVFKMDEAITGALVLEIVFVAAWWIVGQLAATALVPGLEPAHVVMGSLVVGTLAGAWVWNRRRAKRIAKARHLRGELPT